MLKHIVHVGITVNDIERSKKFYSEVLGLKFQSQLVMEGKETDKLFNMENIRVKVAYLNGGENISCPPVELIQFERGKTINKISKVNQTSISEICFLVDDMDKFYKNLLENNVECLSAPQYFDFTSSGGSKSKAIYFKDIDGIILEAMEYLK